MSKPNILFSVAGLIAIGSYLLWGHNQPRNGHEALAQPSPTEVAQVDTKSISQSPVAKVAILGISTADSVALNDADGIEKNHQQSVDTELDAKLGEALDAFNANMAEVSADDVREQRAEIARIKKEALEAPIVEPTIEVVEDKFGNKMKKLTYDNGVVRYSFL